MPRRTFGVSAPGPIRQDRPRDVTMHPGRVSDELLQEQSGCNRAAIALPRVFEIRNVALQLFAQILEQWQAPKLLARRVRSILETLRGAVVIHVEGRAC